MRIHRALLLLALVGCTRHGLGDGLQVRGRLAEGFERMTAARGADTGTVDTLVAIPHTAGTAFLEGAHSVPADPDQPFAITVEPSYDHLLLLVDTQAAEDPTILSYLAMSAGYGTVVNMGTSDATSDVEMGFVRAIVDEAVSEEDLSGVFEMSQEQFTALAEADDAFKNIANAWLNDDPESGVRTRIDMNFWFNGTYEQAGTPGAAPFRSMGPTIIGNHPLFADDQQSLCDGTRSLVLTPPGPVTLANGASFDTDQPLTNQGLDQYCTNQGLTMGQTGGEAFLALAAGVVEQLPSGWWTLHIDDTEIGFFQLDLAMPTDDGGNLRVPVPTVELSEDDTGVELLIRWWRWDDAAEGYVEVDDIGLIERLFASSGVQLLSENFAGEWEGTWDVDPVITSARFDGWTLDGSVAGERQVAQEVAVAYSMAGSQYLFSWKGNSACGNGVIEGDEECDGAEATPSCGAFGAYEPGVVTCTDQCTVDLSDCAQGAVADWTSGAPLTDGTGAYAEHPDRALPLFDGAGVGVPQWVGVQVTRDSLDVLNDGPVFATLVLDGLGVGTVGLGPIAIGDAHTAWFEVPAPVGTASITADLQLATREPEADPALTVSLPSLVPTSSTADGAAFGDLVFTTVPDVPVLGGLHAVVASTLMSAGVPLPGSNLVHHGVTPVVVTEGTVAVVEDVELHVLGAAATSMCADLGCTQSLTNPVVGGGFLSQEVASEVEVTATLRWVDPVGSIAPVFERTCLGEGGSLHSPWPASTVIGSPTNTTALSELVNSEPSGVSTNALPVDIGFNATFTNTAAVDVVLDRIQATVPSFLTWDPTIMAIWQPSDQNFSNELYAPVIDGNTWTWHGRYRIPAGGELWVGFGGELGAEGSHTLGLRGYVGSTAIDATLDTGDDAPLTTQVDVTLTP